MMNVLLLVAGDPFYLRGPDGTSPSGRSISNLIPHLIQRLIQECASLGAKLFFAVPENELNRSDLGPALLKLAPNSKLVPIRHKPQGTACIALLAIEYIGREEELLVIDAHALIYIEDQKDMAIALSRAHFLEMLADFRQRQLDAGTLVFHAAAHPGPRPSHAYVALDQNQLVIEAAEQDPISPYATANVYWFARGKDFLAAATEMIAKEAHVDGHYYICPVLNEMILNHAKIGIHLVDNGHGHSS